MYTTRVWKVESGKHQISGHMVHSMMITFCLMLKQTFVYCFPESFIWPTTQDKIEYLHLST